MRFIPQKATKGQDVADFLADHLVSGTSKLYKDLPDVIAEVNLINASSEEQVWQLFFDGASRIRSRGKYHRRCGGSVYFPHKIM